MPIKCSLAQIGLEFSWNIWNCFKTWLVCILPQSLNIWWSSEAEIAMFCNFIVVLYQFAILSAFVITMATAFLIPSRLQLCRRSPVWQSWSTVNLIFVLSGCALQWMSKHCVKPWHSSPTDCAQYTQKPLWGSSHLSLWLHHQLIWPKTNFHLIHNMCTHMYVHTHTPFLHVTIHCRAHLLIIWEDCRGLIG